jgi:light-regulated signal transduction histidine kinase (bacteriophytochrome)
VTAAEIANDEVENRDQSYYCVTISDNGIGIDNQYVENIFRLFRRLHSSQSNYEGKGIGLAICQRIMTNHQGYITGEGNNEGASFSMYFPI